MLIFRPIKHGHLAQLVQSVRLTRVRSLVRSQQRPPKTRLPLLSGFVVLTQIESIMNLRDEILKEHSKRQVVKIGTWIGNNKSRFAELMELFLHDEYLVTQRSAWIISYCADNHPQLITPWLPEMVKKMQEEGVHDAVKRNVVRVFAGIDIPKPLIGKIMAVCFDELNAPESPIAVKVHAMRVLASIAKQEPDILGELKDTIHLVLQHPTGALHACARKVWKGLERIEGQ